MRPWQLGLGLLLFAVESVSAAPARVSYLDGLDGREHGFLDASDEVLLRFDGSWSSPERAALERTLGVAPAEPYAHALGLGVYRTLDPDAVIAHVRALQPADNTRSQPRSVRVRRGLRSAEGGRRVRLVPGRVVVQLDPGLSRPAIEAILTEEGCRALDWFWTPGLVRAEIRATDDPFEILDRLTARPEIRFAEPDLVGFDDALYAPNDPLYPDQWSLTNAGQFGGRSGADIDVARAWNVTRGMGRVVIAVLDTGVELTHPDLQANLLSRPTGEDWSFDDGDSTGTPTATGWHGTAVAGLAAGRGNNGIGLAGVAPECSILPLKLDLSAGSYANRADAINYAASWVSRVARVVINGSWKTDVDDPAIRAACAAAVQAGCVLVFAAGNSGGEVEYPARYPSVLAVGMTTPCDTRVHDGDTCDVDGISGNSNFGAALDVVAPGSLMTSSDLLGASGFSGGDYVAGLNGTSFAAPIVSGLAALLWSADTTLTASDIATLITGTAEDRVGDPAEDSPGWDPYYGHGRVNAFEAMKATGRTPPVGFVAGSATAAGAPLAGAEARLVGDWPVAPDTTNAGGAFDLGAVPSGIYALRCIAPGIGPRFVRGVTVVESQLATVSVDLSAGFDDDVEFGPANWTHERGAIGWFDQWHVEDQRNHTPGGAHAWKCGSTFEGTGYSRPNHSMLFMPPIDVQLGQRLTFFHRMNADVVNGTQARHGGRVEGSLDGGLTWSLLVPAGGYGYVTPPGYTGPFGPGAPLFSGSHDWRKVEIDLGALQGRSLRVRFVFAADVSGSTAEGWYVDDVSIETNTAVAVADLPSGSLPASLVLRANVPNPFHGSTALRFELDQPGSVRLLIVDASGREVRRLADGPVGVGAHEIVWDGTDGGGRRVADGVYYGVLVQGTTRLTRSLLLLR